jgi:tyrosinase
LKEACRKSKVTRTRRASNHYYRFWNWQLDWQDVTRASIWNAEDGFGTTGNVEQSKHAILEGYCVKDGPFKDFMIPYLDEKYYPHCLSRGFLEGEELEHQSKLLSPDIIEELLSFEDYSSFNLGLEHGPHLAIPHSIRGDFYLLTAPSGKCFPSSSSSSMADVATRRPSIFSASRPT